jgi:uncharacterized membrane protein YeaQ/YmgE (transglycosylase-associated protein family)
MGIINLLISLISGAVGGNIAGAAMKDKSLGTLGNSIAGIFGGGIGNILLQALGIITSAAGTGPTIGSIIGNIGASGIGGAILLIIVALIKNAMKKT